MGLGVGSHVERGFSWERNGPLKACVMALRLKAHTADAAILLLYGGMARRDKTERDMILTITYITIYVSGSNVKLRRQSACSSCVIKP